MWLLTHFQNPFTWHTPITSSQERCSSQSIIMYPYVQWRSCSGYICMLSRVQVFCVLINWVPFVVFNCFWTGWRCQVLFDVHDSEQLLCFTKNNFSLCPFTWCSWLWVDVWYIGCLLYIFIFNTMYRWCRRCLHRVIGNNISKVRYSNKILICFRFTSFFTDIPDLGLYLILNV